MVTYARSAEEYIAEVLASNSGLVKPPGGVLVANGTRPFRAGELIAVNSSTFKAAPRKSAQLSATAANAQASITVDDSWAFEVADVVTVGDATGTYTILSINRTTHVIVLTAVLSGGTNPHPLDSRVYVNANAVFTAIGVALTPMIDEKDITKALSEGDGVYGDLAIRGAFIEAKLQNLDSDAKTDLGGASEINGTYIV